VAADVTDNAATDEEILRWIVAKGGISIGDYGTEKHPEPLTLSTTGCGCCSWPFDDAYDKVPVGLRERLEELAQ